MNVARQPQIRAGQASGVIGLERFGAGGVLRLLAVASAYQGLGAGRALVSRLENDARAAGVEQLVLLTETAQAFFGELGYEVIDPTCRMRSSKVPSSVSFARPRRSA